MSLHEGAEFLPGSTRNSSTAVSELKSQSSVPESLKLPNILNLGFLLWETGHRWSLGLACSTEAPF